METEAHENSRRCFWGENGRPLRLCSRRIDKGGPGQYYSNIFLLKQGVIKNFFTVTVIVSLLMLTMIQLTYKREQTSVSDPDPHGSA